MSGEIEWRWADPRGQQRLVRTDELRAALATGIIAPNAPVWRRGWREWRPAYDVPELSTSAMAAVNGIVPNIPPPPLFVVASQSQFEDRSAGSGAAARSVVEEPPPPPRYIPAATKPAPAPISSAPPAPSPAPKGPTNTMGINTPSPHRVNDRTPAPKSGLTPGYKSAAVTGASPGHKSAAQSGGSPVPARKTMVGVAPASTPPPSGSEHLKRAMTATERPSSSPGSSPGRASEKRTPVRPEPVVLEPEANTSVSLQAVTESEANEKLSRADAVGPARDGVRTVVGVPAIQDPRAAKARLAAAAAAKAAERAPQKNDKAPASTGKPKRSTLILYGGAPSEEDGSPKQPERASAPPIVVPAPGTQAGKNAVTRPPPWGEGAVEIGPTIPKSPRLPRLGNERRDESVEELSGSMLVEQTDDGPMLHHLSPSRPPPAVTAGPGRAGSIPPKRPSGSQRAATPGPGATGTLVGVGAPKVSRPSESGVPPVSRTAPPQESPRVPTPRAQRTSGTARQVHGVPAETAGFEGVSLSDSPDVPYPWMKPLFAKWPALHRVQQGKPRMFLPVTFGLGALVALIGLGAILKVALSPGAARTEAKATDPSTRMAVTTTGSAAPAVEQPRPSAAPAEIAPAVVAAPCTVVGQPKSIAPQVQVASGVEVVPSAQGLALGFASAPKEAVTLLLDPATLSATADPTTKTPDLIRRVMPVPGATKVAISTDRKVDALDGRRTSSGAAPIDFGVAGGHLAWAARADSKTNPLWPLAGEGAVEALRAVPLENKGYAVTFRRGASIWTGVVAGEDKSLAAKGDLVETKGLGPQVGSPSIASSGDTTMVLWADRASADEPWALRFRRWRAGETPEAAKTFNVPAGGLGAPYMSPGVAALGGGRFLVVWTEGPVSSHQVRALTLDEKGNPQGSALTISSEGANAGQGQAAVLPDGRGAVAYLVADGKGFELMATSIACPR